jgi:hypothetical protein
MAETVEQVETGKRPTPAQVQREIDELKAQLSAIAAQVGGSTDLGLDELRAKVDQMTLQLAAMDARRMTADIVLNNAQKVLDRLEAEKQRYGKYKWLGENHYFKSRDGKPATWEFYSDAKTERDAIEDFKRRNRVQYDSTDKRGDPFKAVKIDPALLEAPKSL